MKVLQSVSFAVTDLQPADADRAAILVKIYCSDMMPTIFTFFFAKINN